MSDENITLTLPRRLIEQLVTKALEGMFPTTFPEVKVETFGPEGDVKSYKSNTEAKDNMQKSGEKWWKSKATTGVQAYPKKKQNESDSLIIQQPIKSVFPEIDIHKEQKESDRGTDSPVCWEPRYIVPSTNIPIQEIEEHFQLKINQDMDKMISVLSGKHKTTPFEGEPASITKQVVTDWPCYWGNFKKAKKTKTKSKKSKK